MKINEVKFDHWIVSYKQLPWVVDLIEEFVPPGRLYRLSFSRIYMLDATAFVVCAFWTPRLGWGGHDTPGYCHFNGPRDGLCKSVYTGCKGRFGYPLHEMLCRASWTSHEEIKDIISKVLEEELR